MKTPVNAVTTESQATQTVSSAAGGAGAAISNTTKSVSVTLRNIGEYDFEYQVDAGAWTRLRLRSSVTLAVDMSIQTIKTRKVTGGGNSSAVLDLVSMAGTFSAGNDAAVDPNVVPIREQTAAAYTLVAADLGAQVDMNNASPNTVTVPPNSEVPFPIGTRIPVCMKGAGATTIQQGAGVTLLKPAAKSFTISAQYERAELHKVAVNTWRVNAT